MKPLTEKELFTQSESLATHLYLCRVKYQKELKTAGNGHKLAQIIALTTYFAAKKYRIDRCLFGAKLTEVEFINKEIREVLR